MRNLLTIRSHRPPKPWPCVQDLSVFVPYPHADDVLRETLRTLWGHSFYPSQVYLPLTDDAFEKVRSGFPNLVQVRPSQRGDMNAILDRMLEICEGQFVAIVPTHLSVAPNEGCFLERSLNPLLNSDQKRIAFELVEADAVHWGAVFRKDELLQARKAFPDKTICHAAKAAGIEIRKPAEAEYPFQFDNLLTAVTNLMQDGQWQRASGVLDYMDQHYCNHSWMQTLRVNALYQAGNINESLMLSHQLNQVRPTAARLLIEARCHRKAGQFKKAAEVYRRSQDILENGYVIQGGSMSQLSEQQNAQTKGVSEQRQEKLIWIS